MEGAPSGTLPGPRRNSRVWPRSAVARIAGPAHVGDGARVGDARAARCAPRDAEAGAVRRATAARLLSTGAPHDARRATPRPAVYAGPRPACSLWPGGRATPRRVCRRDPSAAARRSACGARWRSGASLEPGVLRHGWDARSCALRAGPHQVRTGSLLSAVTGAVAPRPAGPGAAPRFHGRPGPSVRGAASRSSGRARAPRRLRSPGRRPARRVARAELQRADAAEAVE
jgi:hypothetical protein